VHATSWPLPSKLGGDAALVDPTIDVLQHVRRSKTEAKVSQRNAVTSLSIAAPDATHDALRAGAADLSDAGSVADIVILSADALTCDVTLAEPAT